MALRDVLAGLANRTHGFMSNFGVRITDTFARTTSGSLGNATTGNVWSQTNGVWYANSGVAVTATAASSYPFATTPYNTSMTATVQSASSGSGIVFWQSGANDWWAAASSGSTSQYISSYTCVSNACCTGANNCTYNACCTGANNCASSTTCGASYYAGTYNACCTGANNCTYNACCTGSNNCASSTTCGASYYAGVRNDCCTGSNNCGASSSCGQSVVCNNCNPGWSGPCGGTCSRYITANKQTVYYYAGFTYYAGSYNPCCTGFSNCVASASCGASYYAGTYNACCTGANNCSASSCCTGSNNCSASNSCGASSYAGTYSACCTGSNNCASSSCCTGSNNCASNACCTTTPNYSTQWNWVLSIIKNVSSSISTVATSAAVVSYSNVSGINAVKVSTSGASVTATGYSDTAATVSVATATGTNSGNFGAGVGIILVPGGTSQASQVGPFTAQ